MGLDGVTGPEDQDPFGDGGAIPWWQVESSTEHKKEAHHAPGSPHGTVGNRFPRPVDGAVCVRVDSSKGLNGNVDLDIGLEELG